MTPEQAMSAVAPVLLGAPLTAPTSFIQNCAQLASATLLYYDHALTFPAELRAIWTRGRGRGAWAFVFIRYLAFIAYILVAIINLVPLSSHACIAFGTARQWLLLVSIVVVACILTARTYALYECSNRILALMLGVGLILLAVACYILFGLRVHSEPMFFFGCHVGISSAAAVHIATAWECLFLYDTLLVVLTLIRGRSLARASGRRGRARGLSAVVARDGVLYYAAAALANGANVLTFYVAPPMLRGFFSNPASALSTVLCARLMLNLHASVESGEHSPVHATTGLLDTAMAVTGLSELDLEQTRTFDAEQDKDPPWAYRTSSVGTGPQKWDEYELGVVERIRTVDKD